MLPGHRWIGDMTNHTQRYLKMGRFEGVSNCPKTWQRYTQLFRHNGMELVHVKHRYWHEIDTDIFSWSILYNDGNLGFDFTQTNWVGFQHSRVDIFTLLNDVLVAGQRILIGVLKVIRLFGVEQKRRNKNDPFHENSHGDILKKTHSNGAKLLYIMSSL